MHDAWIGSVGISTVNALVSRCFAARISQWEISRWACEGCSDFSVNALVSPCMTSRISKRARYWSVRMEYLQWMRWVIPCFPARISWWEISRWACEGCSDFSVNALVSPCLTSRISKRARYWSVRMEYLQWMRWVIPCFPARISWWEISRWACEGCSDFSVNALVSPCLTSRISKRARYWSVRMEYLQWMRWVIPCFPARISWWEISRWACEGCSDFSVNALVSPCLTSRISLRRGGCGKCWVGALTLWLLRNQGMVFSRFDEGTRIPDHVSLFMVARL